MMKDKEIHPIEDTVECVEALAKIIRENDLGRIKISSDDFEIVVEGKRCPPPPPRHDISTMPMSVPIAGVPGGVPSAAPTPVEKAPAASGNIVTSPIIGTFYSSPSPEKPPFVRVGDTVSAGDVICIIESMKLMNEINSDFSGKVAEIYVNNGDPVEFGQKIMRIE